MPGFIIYGRRWSIGSDDLLVPGLILAVMHFIWLIVLIVYLSMFEMNQEEPCQVRFWRQLVGYVVVWSVNLTLELGIVLLSTRGSIFNDGPRKRISILIYIKQVMWLAELCWCGLGIFWLYCFYTRSSCSLSYSNKNLIMGLVICNLIGLLLLILVFWCSYDYAGRSWLKLKKFQERALQNSSKFKESRYSGIHRRSGGTSRNWRHRKVRRQYQSSWDMRCRMLFCCARKDRKSKTSFAEIAGLLSEFFRDLDVVPTDVLVGLVLLRQRQQAVRQKTISQPTNNVYDFLSGVKVTPETKFVALNNPKELDKLRETVHYMYFALAAYGWPMYLLHNKTVPVHKAAWRLLSGLRCCNLNCWNHKPEADLSILEDNCCMCNYSAMKQVCLDSTEVVYVTYHVEVGETPFFIGVDFDKETIVISIRGTLSIQDILTDLNAESEILPLISMNEDFKGHKGMVQAAQYIYRKVLEENLLDKAFNWRPQAGTNNFPLVCVGHSLGGGTAAILAILLRQHYPSTTCYAYSPPGGLLSEAAMLASREYMTSVVMGKDVVPRLGLHQMETLRHDLIATIKQSNKNKWETLSTSILCSKAGHESDDDDDSAVSPSAININPLDSSINLSVHQPLYPPGNIIHIVRHHPNDKKYARKEPIYQAVWADNYDFDQVLISKCMIQDHMPDVVLDALEKACCTHAWHAVYTSKTICGPTVDAKEKRNQVGEGKGEGKGKREADRKEEDCTSTILTVEIQSAPPDASKVSSKYERILHENHNQVYTIHDQPVQPVQTEPRLSSEGKQCTVRTQYVHVQHANDPTQHQLETCNLENSPRRNIGQVGDLTQIESGHPGPRQGGTQIGADPKVLHLEIRTISDQNTEGDKVKPKNVVAKRDLNNLQFEASDNLAESARSFIDTVRESNRDFQRKVTENKSGCLHKSGGMDQAEHTHTLIHSESTCTTNLNRVQSLQCDRKNQLTLVREVQSVESGGGASSGDQVTRLQHSQASHVTFNEGVDGHGNVMTKAQKVNYFTCSENTKKVQFSSCSVQRNGLARVPVASPEPMSEVEIKRLSPMGVENDVFESCELLNKSLPELFNIVSQHLAPGLNPSSLNPELAANLKHCRSSSDITTSLRQAPLIQPGSLVQDPVKIEDLQQNSSILRTSHRSRELRKIRTPSDIFSFYDISREEATTV